jgi:hypothetical protein
MIRQMRGLRNGLVIASLENDQLILRLARTLSTTGFQAGPFMGR